MKDRWALYLLPPSHNLQSMPSSNLPPLGSDYVFSVSSSALIDAPRDKIWSIMLDFPSYTNWNTFVRKMTVTSASKEPLADQTPAEGKHIHMNVHMPPTMGEPGCFGAQKAFVIISSVEPDNYRVAWKTAGMPSFLLHTERWQALSMDDVSGKTKYETIEVFGGVLAYLVKLFVGEKLKVAFRAAADSLKTKAEQS
ncbi:hypothetical protein D9619_011772 [Psilocybe cf. subviscida]|uniref:Coenzyme Q-binding protein COQ10 START domain-containing protein n=1 Tax=Psilocybe cf. subviscida TaxID=2480587 RepID=A0A8H5B0L4_9AGAR|nr:hypothetical protein D9619_011772 [Psilocybe cf. subviscida]